MPSASQCMLANSGANTQSVVFELLNTANWIMHYTPRIVFLQTRWTIMQDLWCLV